MQHPMNPEQNNSMPKDSSLREQDVHEAAVPTLLPCRLPEIKDIMHSTSFQEKINELTEPAMIAPVIVRLVLNIQ